MNKAVFHDAGCPVGVCAEQPFALALDPARHRVEMVHLGEQNNRIAVGEAAAVRSAPAFVNGASPCRIDYGAVLADPREFREGRERQAPVQPGEHRSHP